MKSQVFDLKANAQKLRNGEEVTASSFNFAHSLTSIASPSHAPAAASAAASSADSADLTKKKEKKKKDPNEPKKPPTAYNLFSKKYFKIIQDEVVAEDLKNPPGDDAEKPFRRGMIILGDRWKNITVDDRAELDVEVKKLQDAHSIELAQYNSDHGIVAKKEPKNRKRKDSEASSSSTSAPTAALPQSDELEKSQQKKEKKERKK